MDSIFTFVLFVLFLIVIFMLPWRGGYELFTLGKWRNANKIRAAKYGYCAPDFSKFRETDNVAVRCVGDGNMTYGDCMKLREIGQVGGVNLDTWESYPLQYYSGKACKRCTTQNVDF